MKILNYGKQHLDQNDYNALKSKTFKEFLTTGPLVEKFENNLKKKNRCKICRFMFQWHSSFTHCF